MERDDQMEISYGLDGGQLFKKGNNVKSTGEKEDENVLNLKNEHR